MRRRRAPCRLAGGQALVEFAVVLPLFLFCLIAALDAGLWAVQTSAEVSAVEQAAMIASSAGSDPTSTTAPDARVVANAISGRLRSALFGTAITTWCPPDGNGGCATDASQPCPVTPADVEARNGPRAVVVCVTEHDPPPCTTPPSGQPSPFPPGCDDSPMITVRIIGFVASFVPPGFGPGARGFELPTNISATTHTLRFAP